MSKMCINCVNLLKKEILELHTLSVDHHECYRAALYDLLKAFDLRSGNWVDHNWCESAEKHRKKIICEEPEIKIKLKKDVIMDTMEVHTESIQAVENMLNMFYSKVSCDEKPEEIIFKVSGHKKSAAYLLKILKESKLD